LLRSVTCADQRLLLLRARLALFDDRFAWFAILSVVPCRDPLPALTNSSHATATAGLNFEKLDTRPDRGVIWNMCRQIRAIRRSTVIALALLFAFHCGKEESGS